MDLQQHNELFCSELWLDNHCFMLRKWSPMELMTRYSWQPLILSCSKENLSCAFNCNQSLTSRNRYTCMPLHLTTKLNIYKNNAYLYLELKPSHQFSPNVTMFCLCSCLIQYSPLNAHMNFIGEMECILQVTQIP